MQLKSNKTVVSTRKYWYILLFIILTMLVGFLATGQESWVLLLIISTFIAVICFLVFWQYFIFPEMKFSKHLALSKYIILNQFFNIPLILSVRNGEIEGDYALLKKKPDIHLLCIDQKSAVLIEDSPNHTSLLLHGVHLFNNNPKIIGSFYLGIRSLQIGPENENSLEPKRIQESLTEYHSRINSAEQTKTQLQSGDLIYPSFSILYRFDKKDLDINELGIFLGASKLINGDKSSPFSFHKFETYLIDEILFNWRNFCKNKKPEDILVSFPGKYEPIDLRISGVIFQIYLDDIY